MDRTPTSGTAGDSMSLREHFVTPSGKTVWVRLAQASRHPDRQKLVRYQGEVSVGSLRTKPVVVNVSRHSNSRRSLEQAGFSDLAIDLDSQAVLGVLYAIERGLADEEPEESLELDVNDRSLLEFLKLPPASDRELRQFLARRAYEEYTRATLDVLVTIDAFDHLLTRATDQAFERNIDLLSAERLLKTTRSFNHDRIVQPTASLVRQVEKYGCAEPDAVAGVDFPASVRSTRSLEPWAEQLLEEYGRYATAITSVQLHSVGRALTPIVEAIAKELAASRGSRRTMNTLGDAIRELQNRRVVTPDMVSKLSHVVEFVRDIILHGAHMSDVALRLVCDTSFELALSLAAQIDQREAR